ncbi:hypothetical protein Btru_065385 [Bulinus truncatus]|nr:hypothetical protein Btru_065385 [Bulinus truncatus]
MRSFLLSLFDDLHDKRPWRGTILICAFIALTLAMNASAREQAALIRQAYQDSNDSVLLIFISALAAGQIVLALSLFSLETVRGELPNREALVIVIFCHAGNIFLHDYLASMGSSEASLCTAFFQPLLTLVALSLVTSVIPRPASWASTIIIGCGCTFMSINKSTVFNSDRTSLICALSAFSFILRNMVVKQLVGPEHVTPRTRSKKTFIFVAVASVLFLLVTRFQVSPVLQVSVLCGLVTCFLSAALVYVTVQLLRSQSVMIISLFYVWALLLEALIITPLVHKPDIFSFVAAVTFVVLGHYAFIKDHQDHHLNTGLIPSHAQKAVNIYEQYTRIEFLMFTCLVLGVIFYVFQPKVSQRDLQTLSYVGLDKVIRKLLTFEPVDLSSIDDEQAHPHQLP